MEDTNTLRKRLFYQSQHRGMRELDFLLGGFSHHHLSELTEDDLKHFEALLDFPDQVLYGFFFENAPLPEGISSDLVRKIVESLDL